LICIVREAHNVVRTCDGVIRNVITVLREQSRPTGTVFPVIREAVRGQNSAV
jgi:hypothetical protein